MLTTIKLYARYAVKLYKNKPKIFQTGGASRLACPGSALAVPHLGSPHLDRTCSCVFGFNN